MCAVSGTHDVRVCTHPIRWPCGEAFGGAGAGARLPPRRSVAPGEAPNLLSSAERARTVRSDLFRCILEQSRKRRLCAPGARRAGTAIHLFTEIRRGYGHRVCCARRHVCVGALTPNTCRAASGFGRSGFGALRSGPPCPNSYPPRVRRGRPGRREADRYVTVY